MLLLKEKEKKSLFCVWSVASQTIHKSVFILRCGVCLAERSKDWWVKVPSSRKPPVDPLGTDSVLTLDPLGPGSALCPDINHVGLECVLGSLSPQNPRWEFSQQSVVLGPF